MKQLLAGSVLASLLVVVGCGGSEEPALAEATQSDGVEPWRGGPDPAVVGGPGPVTPDRFHPDHQPDAEGNRPPMPPVRDGGRVIVHLASMPRHINYMTENSAVSRWILREVHDFLIKRDWSTWEHEGNLAREFWQEDRVETKDGRTFAGEVTRTAEALTVTPIAAGNALTEPVTLALDEVEGIFEGTIITCDLVETEWHDGHPFDAADVHFSWQCYRNPHVDCEDVREGQSKVTQCEVLGERLVRFTFDEPYFLALDVFDALTIVPSHHYNLSDPDNEAFVAGVDPLGEQQGSFVNDNPHNFDWIGLGPYRMVEVNDQYLEAVKIDDYFDPARAGHVEKIRWRCIPNDDAAKAALINGELDYFARLRSEDYLGDFCRQDAFVEDYYAGYSYQPRMQYVAWNARRPQLADPEVRRALAHAMDWDEFIATQASGLGVRIVSTVFYLSPMYDHSIRPIPYDLGKAEEILEDAGWYDRNGNGIRDKDGVELEFSYLMTPGNKASEIMFNKLKENFDKIGVLLDSEKREWATFIEHVKEKDFDAMGMAWVLEVESDPYQLWHSDSGKNRGSNYPGVYDERLDDLIRQIQVTVDDEARQKLWFEFQRINYELQPYMYTYMVPIKFAMSKRVRGFKSYGLNPGYSIRDWYIVDDASAAATTNQ
ncbi:MAG: ABC transporter substrate-binding protein [Planctomycetota bacterium]